MARTALGAVRYANTRRLPPHQAQVKTSNANFLRSNCAWSTRAVLSFFGSLLTAAWGVTLAPSSPPWGSALARPEHPAVLHAGRWCLRPVKVIPAAQAQRYPISTMEWQFGQPPPLAALAREGAPLRAVLGGELDGVWRPALGGGDDPLFPLRAPSSEDDGRVKSWRKRARDGTLPPALVLYVDLLGKWLVLDGHDRLHAALLEGVTPPLLGLWPVHEKVLPSSPEGHHWVMRSAEHHLSAGATPSVVDRVNRMLRVNFQGHMRSTVTRT